MSDYSNQETAAIFLCGGKGTRLREITGKTLPKSLLRVYGKELIRYSYDAIAKHGSLIGSNIFAVGFQKEQLIAWIDEQDGDTTKKNIVIEQSAPGVVGAITAASAVCDAKRFIICNTDEVRTNIDIDQILSFHKQHGQKATIVATKANALYRHRILELEDTLVHGSKLKAHEYLDAPDKIGVINTGIVVVEREALAVIDTRAHGNDWSALINPLHDNRELRAFVDESIYYFNVGTPQELEETEMWLTANAANSDVA